mmetsp:Transcript_135492/g.270340  ORF Transcript_135492/g.270340 Transcript_135492/m.270340 type:complete len:682 (+) Transcript_135492:77-2122(+)
MAEGLVRSAVIAGCPKGVESDVAEYLVTLATSLLEEEGTDFDTFLGALSGSFSPFLEDFDVPATDIAAFCEVVCRAVFKPVTNFSESTVNTNDGRMADRDLLCRLPNLLMMYGGSPVPLLKDATLELMKGHLYGVVGANGTGKSTLMNKIATKDIIGFPEAIRVVHLSHDKLLQGVDPSMVVQDYVKMQGGGGSENDFAQALSGVGFDAELLQKRLSALSGGWQMRFALARAVAQKANLLVLDEPTNHLDAAGVQWLVDFLAGTCVAGATCGSALIVSHDPGFLDMVCTDIVHFTSEGKLSYHKGNFNTFKTEVLRGNQDEADRLLEISQKQPVSGRMEFPVPGKIGATVAARKLPVLTFQGGAFGYDAEKEPILTEVDVKLSMESRVVITGANGVGKSTLLALLANRLTPTRGELWWNTHLRLAYVAQSHLVHLGESLMMTPVEYIQARFRGGFDATTPEKEARALTTKEDADRKRLGMQFGKKSKPVQAVLSRKEQVQHGGAAGEKEYLYEVQWEGLGDAERSWENRGKLNKCGASALADDLDARLWYAWAGVEQRSTSEKDVVQHLALFGLPEKIVVHRKISMLSGGQKVKLMFGAAFWTRPHVLCLDEPTNYLDVESVGMLQDALVGFRGGYAVVTHNMAFAEEISNEIWTIAGGRLSGAKRIWGKAKAKAKASTVG